MTKGNAPVTVQNRSGKNGWLWIRLGSVLAILWWVIAKNGRGRIVDTLLSANLSWVLLAAACFFVSIIAGAYQWFLLLRLQGIDFGFAASFRTYYSGMFLNNFLPGTVGGDALRVYQVKQGSEGWGKAVAATFLDRLIGFFTLSLLALVSVLLTLWHGTLDQVVFRHLFYAVAFIFCSFVMVLIFLLSNRVAVLTHALIRWTSLRWLDEAYSRLQNILVAYQAKWGRMGYVLLVSWVVQILRIDVHWFSAIGLGVHISPVFFFSFIPVIALAGVIPLNVGGWGIPQSIATFLYTLPGVLGSGVMAAGIASQTPADLKVTAAALAFLPSVIGLVVMLGGGFYFISGKSGKKNHPETTL